MLLTWFNPEFPKCSLLWCNPVYKALQNPWDKYRANASINSTEVNKAVYLWVTLGDRRMICHKAMLLSHSDSSHIAACPHLEKADSELAGLSGWG